MSLPDAAWGYITAILAVIFFGSFNIPLKAERTQKAKPDPMIFQIYMNIAIFASSWLVLSYNDLVLTPWGVLSAALWVSASILSIFAINMAGLAVSQGIWAGFTIIVSFFWGAVIFEQPLGNVGLSIVGLIMLVLGITGMSIAGSDLLVRTRHSEESQSLSLSESPLQQVPIISTKRKIFGYFCAALLAIPNGSMLAPIHYSPDYIQGVNFLVSFGIGVLAVTPLFAVVYFVGFQKKTRLER